MNFRVTLATLVCWYGVANAASLTWSYDPTTKYSTITDVHVDDSEWVDVGRLNMNKAGWYGDSTHPKYRGRQQCFGGRDDVSSICYPRPSTLINCATRTSASGEIRKLIGLRAMLGYDPNEYPFSGQQFVCWAGAPSWTIRIGDGGGLPTPASCTAASMNVVMAGVVGSPVPPWSGDLAITCSKPADIVLTLPRGGTVDLGGGQSHVAFGQGGIKVSVHASPTATVKLFASVDGVINKAGTYTGSTEVILDVQ